MKFRLDPDGMVMLNIVPGSDKLIIEHKIPILVTIIRPDKEPVTRVTPPVGRVEGRILVVTHRVGDRNITRLIWRLHNTDSIDPDIDPIDYIVSVFDMLTLSKPLSTKETVQLARKIEPDKVEELAETIVIGTRKHFSHHARRNK